MFKFILNFHKYRKPCWEEKTVFTVVPPGLLCNSVINHVRVVGGGVIGDCLVLEKKLLPIERISNGPTAKPARTQVSCGPLPLC